MSNGDRPITTRGLYHFAKRFELAGGAGFAIVLNFKKIFRPLCKIYYTCYEYYSD